MTDSIETSEDMATPWTPVNAVGALAIDTTGLALNPAGLEAARAFASGLPDIDVAVTADTETEAIEAVIACLGDDAATLRAENDESEIADNMDKAATLLGRLLPAATLPGAEQEDAVLAYLDALRDDAIAHIWPEDLRKCQTSECVVEVASVRLVSPSGKTLPLFSREQVRDAIRAARSGNGGAP